MELTQEITQFVCQTLSEQLNLDLKPNHRFAAGGREITFDFCDTKRSVFGEWISSKPNIPTRRQIDELLDKFFTTIKVFNNASFFIVLGETASDARRHAFADQFEFKFSAKTKIYDLRDLLSFAGEHKISTPTAIGIHSLVPETSNLEISSFPPSIDITQNPAASQSNKLEARSYWWINDAEEFTPLEKLEIGQLRPYPKKRKDGTLRGDITNIAVGDLLLGYQKSPHQRIVSIYKLEPPTNEDDIQLKVVYLFSKMPEWQDIKLLFAFQNSAVIKKNIQGTVFPLTYDEFIAIIKQTELPESALENIEAFSKKTKPQKNTSSIAVIENDSILGQDLLDISADINAFAKIVASKDFQPPLAIALFGNWGSGKSFFMEKMRTKIDQLAARKNSESFCNGVVQIHFNAWSYLDANLWASLVTQIFEKLNQYIKADEAKAPIKKEIEDKLSSELTISKVQKELLEKQKKELEAKLKTLTESKTKTKDILKEKLDSIKTSSIQKVISEIDTQFSVENRITKAVSENPNLSETIVELKKYIPKEYWNRPETLIKHVKSNYSIFRYFFRKDKMFVNVTTLSGIIILISLVPYLLTKYTNWAKDANFEFTKALLSSLTILLYFLSRLRTTILKLQPVIAAFWQIRNDYEKEIKEARFKLQQEEKAIMLEIEESKNEILLFENSIQETTKEINSLDFKLQNLLSTEALYSFIEKRSSSEDYKKHLGLISIIRKDFEILSELLTEHAGEAGFSKLDKPIERIVLYIDDLDRCTEDRVVEVLEAVNLLMAYKLFVVVVGVDPRWVKNALQKKYNLQFSKNEGNTSPESLSQIGPSNYLEKIFQIPFNLKDSSDANIKAMIADLSRTKINLESRINLDEAAFDQGFLFDQVKQKDQNIAIQSEKMNLTETSMAEITPGNENDEVFVHLTEDESRLLQSLSEIIGHNPRGVKRFVNSYKIVKAHESLHLSKTNDNIETKLIMFLLALAIGPFRDFATEIYQFLSGFKFESLNAFFLGRKEAWKEGKSKLDKLELLHSLLKDNNDFEDVLKVSPMENRNTILFTKRFTFAELI